MKTDWQLIRQLINTAIDACEQVEAAGYTESDREATVMVGNVDVKVCEFLQSAWIMPENYTYMAIRARHELKENKPYTPEFARVLRAIAYFCSELIGTNKLDEQIGNINPHMPGQFKSLRELAIDLESWYGKEFAQGITKALSNSNK